MGGSTGGGLGGAILGTLIAPGVGTTLGALGGSAVGGLLGGGGGSTQPAAQPVQTAQGLFQSYTPQAQQQQDYTFQGLQGELGNLAWSGLGALGGQQPAGQLYSQFRDLAQNIAGQNDLLGAYGPYGNVALGKDLWGLGTLQDIYGGPQNLLNYGQQTGAAGLAALPQVQQAAFSPQIGQAVQNVIANPYYGQQLAGAQTGAGIGAQAAAVAPWQAQLLGALGGQLPAAGAQAAATTGAQIPWLQQLAQNQAATGANLAAQAETGILPQLEQLYGQTVPGLLQAGGQVAGQAQATTPQLQDIAARGVNLTSAAPYLQQVARETSAGLPQAQQQILQTGLDPQGALFNQLSQQTRDQANAIGAMSGLAGTPYAAGLTNDAMRNFNIQWQNQQLQRQATADQTAAALANQQLAGTQAGANILGGLIQQGSNIGLGAAQQQLANVLGGAGAYGNLVGQAGQLGGNLVQGQLGALTGAGNLFGQGAQGASALAGQAGTLANMGLNQQIAAAQGAQGLFQGGLNLGQGGAQLAQQAGAMPAGAYNAQQQAALNALGMQNQFAGQGVQNLAGLTAQLGAAGQQPIAGITAAEQIAAQPYNMATQQAQNAITALQNQAAFGNQLMTLPQNVINNALNYLRAGQGAAQTGGFLQGQGFNQTQQQLQGLGALGQLGTSALFGNQGLLGGGGGGLLGNLGSGTGNTGLLNSLLGNNFQGTGLSAADYAAVGTDPALLQQAYAQANSPGLFGWLGNLFGGGGGGFG